MTKNEFVQYAVYLEKLFNLNISEDKQVMAAWYKPFENTHIAIAKMMADTYLQEEQGRFKLAKLLEYKSKVMASKTYSEPKKDKCLLCNDTGFIQIEVPYRSTYTTKCARCLCNIGDSLPKYVRQVEKEELENGDFYNGVIRRRDLHPKLDVKTV